MLYKTPILYTEATVSGVINVVQMDHVVEHLTHVHFWTNYPFLEIIHLNYPHKNPFSLPMNDPSSMESSSEKSIYDRP